MLFRGYPDPVTGLPPRQDQWHGYPPPPVPSRTVTGQGVTPPPPREQIHACENITLHILWMRAVINIVVTFAKCELTFRYEQCRSRYFRIYLNIKLNKSLHSLLKVYWEELTGDILIMCRYCPTKWKNFSSFFLFWFSLYSVTTLWA